MLSNVINFQERKNRKLKTKNYNFLINQMVEYFRLIKPKTPERVILAFAVASVEDKRNSGSIDEFNNLKPIA